MLVELADIVRQANIAAARKFAAYPADWCSTCYRVHKTHGDRIQSHRQLDAHGDPINDGE